MNTVAHVAFTAFALLFVGMLVLGGVLVLYISLLSRRTAAAARLLTSLGARASSVHRSAQRPAAAATVAGLAAIAARDRGFDPQLLLDATTRLLYLHTSVLDNGDDTVLDGVVDERFCLVTTAANSATLPRPAANPTSGPSAPAKGRGRGTAARLAAGHDRRGRARVRGGGGRS